MVDYGPLYENQALGPSEINGGKNRNSAFKRGSVNEENLNLKKEKKTCVAAGQDQGSDRDSCLRPSLRL